VLDGVVGFTALSVEASLAAGGVLAESADGFVPASELSPGFTLGLGVLEPPPHASSTVVIVTASIDVRPSEECERMA
jgi:hypothetical protein